MSTNLEEILNVLGDGDWTSDRYRKAICSAIEQGFKMMSVEDIAIGDDVAYVNTDPFMGSPYGDIQFTRVTGIERVNKWGYDEINVYHSGEWTTAMPYDNVLVRKN